jgi:uncharacterized protein YjbI with pentapeptide repeats
MANEKHLAILRQGVAVWNAWRRENPRIQPDLEAANLSDGLLSGVDLSNGLLAGAKLSGTYFSEASFSSAHLSKADLSRAHLSGADFTGARLHFADLNRADLGRATLRGAFFIDANIDRANLTDADATGAHFIRASLYNTLLGGANLSGAELDYAILTEAHLNGTLLIDANLQGADFTGVVLDATIFGNNDLSEVVGIDTANHHGPSTIGVDTIYKSHGSIPEAFLRGCGVPNSLIEYLPSLLGAMEPIQFYSCFISYSTKDEVFAKRLHSKMRDNNLRVWFANEDLKGGHKLHEQIDEAIRVYDKFIIVLSPESLRSKWVMNEVRRTRKAELANNQRKFFPIALMDYREIEGWECLDPETGTDLAAEIREYYVPDFRDWKNHDSFEKAFTQLLEGLKAVDAPPAPRIEPKTKPKDTPQNVQTVIASKKRRLEKLEERQAIMGISTPPEVLTEIEDLRREIEKLNDIP